MLRASIFVYCALLAVFFLKKKLYRHHYSSMVVIISGVILVGLAFYYKPDADKQKDEYSATDTLIGLIIL
jgi:amino acid permease